MTGINTLDLFEAFPKIPRLNRHCVITEKIDGTNAQVIITEDGDIRAGSRKRLLTVADDNFGFCRWVEGNKEALLELGPGRHFGEWWGSGIGRRYGLSGGDKRFSLFNTSRWTDDERRPECCSVVPVLYQGLFSTDDVNRCIDNLNRKGSVAQPGYHRPEGVIIWHPAARQMFKVTCEDDAAPKSLTEN